MRESIAAAEGVVVEEADDIEAKPVRVVIGVVQRGLRALLEQLSSGTRRMRVNEPCKMEIA